MKKYILICFLSFASSTYAQEQTVLTNKKGVAMLPSAGDFGLGLSAAPIFSYIGNMFNGNQFNGTPNFASAGGTAITGKYFISPTKAYRTRVALNASTSSQVNSVEDVTNTSPVIRYVEDKKTISSSFVDLALGIETRRGSGRLQAIYGWEASLGINFSNESLEYGNQLTAQNTSVPSTFWSGLTPVFTDPFNTRILEVKSGIGFSFGAKGFVGFEYFLAPKISMGGELGYGLSVNTRPKGETIIETFGSELTTEIQPSSSQPSNFRIGTIPTGSIYFYAYF
jgi:hypothetical protein